MQFLEFLVLGYVFAVATAMLYRREADSVLKPDLLPVSSTVQPLPFYSVYGFEKKILRGKYKKRPSGVIELITKQPS